MGTPVPAITVDTVKSGAGALSFRASAPSLVRRPTRGTPLVKIGVGGRIRCVGAGEDRTPLPRQLSGLAVGTGPPPSKAGRFRPSPVPSVHPDYGVTRCLVSTGDVTAGGRLSQAGVSGSPGVVTRNPARRFGARGARP